MMFYDIEATGSRLRQLRKEYGLTQEELAARLNVTDKHIRNLEKAKYGISLDLLVKMSEIFGVSLDYIVLGRQQPEGKLKGQLRALMELLADIDGTL